MPDSNPLPGASTVEFSDPKLIWACLGGQAGHRHVWFGVGLLSDLGLPLDALHMFLAAKQLHRTIGTHRPVTVLLADAHAVSGGTDRATVARRAFVRTLEIHRIGAFLRLPLDVVLASRMDENGGFDATHARAREWCLQRETPYSEYTIRGVADVLHFNHGCGVKVGWTRSANPELGRGRHHEHETDALAADIDPSVSAVYVRHGVTLDSARPTAVPYTETVDVARRLMLTGPDRGRLKAKLFDSAVSKKRQTAVLEHLALTVNAFEMLVGPLSGEGPIEKAADLVARLEDV